MAIRARAEVGEEVHRVSRNKRRQFRLTFVDSRVLALPPKLVHVYLTLLPISDSDQFEDRVPVGFRRELGGGRVRTCREVRTRDLRQ